MPTTRPMTAGRKALWLLTQRGLDVRLGWSKGMHGGKFAGCQPEHLAAEDWEQVILPTATR